MTGAAFTAWEVSPTAANSANRIYGASGVMSYRVILQTATGARVASDVEAASGDEAAELGLASFPGGKVVHIAPSPVKQDAA